jgi:glutathione synthase/RimK-type ligase-like ATP-grasp enzyme
VIRTTWDYTERLDEFLEALSKIEESGCKLLNPLRAVKWNVKKTYLKEVAQKGFPVIESIFLADENLASLTEKLNASESKEFVIKPVVGAGAQKIEILSREDLLEKLLDYDDWSGWFVQPFEKRVQTEGERSFMFFSEDFSHAVIKSPKKGDFRVQEEHGGATKLHEPGEREMELANKVLKAVPESLLYTRIDIMPTDEGPKVIEIELVEPSLYFRLEPSSALDFLEKLRKIIYTEQD